ncbi:signal recognition particle receptor subunit alpha, partial [Mycobacterium tuberculosis]
MSDDDDTGFIVAPIRTGVETGWLARLSKGLSKSSRELGEQVAAVLTKKKLDQDTLDELEAMLIEADLGPAAAARITER